MSNLFRKMLLMTIFILPLMKLSAANPTLPVPPTPIGINAVLNGYVKDAENDETLVGATVSIVGTKKGSYTNRSGYYSIVDIVPGEYKIRVTMVGYNPYEETLKFSKSQTVRKDIKLKTQSVQAEGISVEADRDVETREITISKINVPIKIIKELRIGGESDVFRSIQMLPGVLTSSQISSGLFIRGGSPDQNLVLIDGTTVYNPSHLFGFISSFNSDAIKNVELIKGGYPAEYGSRLSSVIDITQKDGNRNEFEGLVSLGMLSSRAALEGPVLNGSWFISGRASYFDIVQSFIDNDPLNPIPDFGFYDVNAKISQDFGSNDKVFLSGFMSKDNFDYTARGISVIFDLQNLAGSARWTHIFDDNLFMTNNLTSSKYENGMDQDFNGYVINLRNSIEDFSFKSSTEWFASDDLTFNLGGEVTNYIFTYKADFSGEDMGGEVGTNEGGVTNLIYHDWVYGAYFQGNYVWQDLLTIQGGLRFNFWDYSEYKTWDPRIAIRYQFSENLAIKASWGIFHQYLRLAGDENFALFDTWLPTDKTVQPSEATHYILSFETKPLDGFDFTYDIYYKDLKNVSILKNSQLNQVTVSDIFYSGIGEAYGMEFFLQKKVGRFTGWVGYSLGWVNAVFDSVNQGTEFRPKFDRRHDFKVVAQYQPDEVWLFSASFMFQSGQSYTGATSRAQVGMPGDNYGYGKVMPSQRFGLRMPNSHQLNVTASYSTTLFELPFRLILDVYNVYNHKDILMRYYDVSTKESALQDIKLLPIIPSLSFELKF
jgi:hypothetical protein